MKNAFNCHESPQNSTLHNSSSIFYWIHFFLQKLHYFSQMDLHNIFQNSKESQILWLLGTYHWLKALITGSTDGIGKAFAFQLAQKGLNIVLVARNLEKLQQVSSEIQAQNPNTQTKIVVIDFSGDVTKGIQEMQKATEGLDIGVLINNVGVTYPGAMFFHEVDENIWKNVMKENLEGTTLITMAVLPEMIPRGKGAIVNMGSGASAVVPSHPLYTIYAATKAYIDQLSRCLYVEYKHNGIDVQCQVPLYVSTKMTSRVSSIKKSTLFSPSAEEYAKAAVSQIGYGGRRMPYWAHSLQWWIASLLPESLLDAWRLSIGVSRRNKHNVKFS